MWHSAALASLRARCAARALAHRLPTAAPAGPARTSRGLFASAAAAGIAGVAGAAVCDEPQKPAEAWNRRTPLPPRPSLTVLRPEIDARLDSTVLMRFDPPEHLRTGAAVVILPGGNYESCSTTGEGQQVAAWLASLGVTAFVLRYRLISEGHYWPAPLEDLEVAMRLIRTNATKLRVDRLRVGVLGFSAGGHLAGMAAAHTDDEVRPNAQILVYPSIDVTKPEWWPWKATYGFAPPEDSPHLLVTAAAPPAFLTVSKEDGLCTAEENTEPYAQRLKELGVDVEHVVRSMGKHGHGMKPQWTEPCKDWLVKMGWAVA
mmetsp:Transcript_33128/g.72184  ORF Transcript_33128/g.72184 Transcript_33128/m.72184 type:complete len:317 (+) Transcript_33128:58-1008(+)